MISLIPRQNKSLNNINLKTQHLAPRPFRLSRRDEHSIGQFPTHASAFN